MSVLNTPLTPSHTVDIKDQNGSATATVDTSRLLSEIAALSNLEEALKTVVKNKGAPGTDKQDVYEVKKRSHLILPELRALLLTQKYRPGDVRRVWIPKPDGGKRGLGIPNVIDRVVQTAVLQILEPIFEPTFHHSSHGFRTNRGAVTALQEVKQHIAQGYNIVVDMDISKFFDCVNHQRLLSRMAQQIKDGRVLQLIHRMLKTDIVMPDGVRVQTDEGTPQGGPLSPLLSNIVLDELDWELKRRGLRFCRYADDCNVYVRSERAGRRVMESIRRFIEQRLRLKLNEEKSDVIRPENSHFLGFRFTSNPKEEVEVQLSKRSKERIYCRIRSLIPRTWGNTLQSCIAQLNGYLKGWVAYFRQCTKASIKEFQWIDAHIRRRLRALIIRQKKLARNLFRHLKKLGLSRNLAAKTAFSKRGIWNKSISKGMHAAYPNKYFKERGLVFLEHVLLKVLNSNEQLVAVKSGE